MFVSWKSTMRERERENKTFFLWWLNSKSEDYLFAKEIRRERGKIFANSIAIAKENHQDHVRRHHFFFYLQKKIRNCCWALTTPSFLSPTSRFADYPFYDTRPWRYCADLRQIVPVTSLVDRCIHKKWNKRAADSSRLCAHHKVGKLLLRHEW